MWATVGQQIDCFGMTDENWQIVLVLSNHAIQLSGGLGVLWAGFKEKKVFTCGFAGIVVLCLSFFKH